MLHSSPPLRFYGIRKAERNERSAAHEMAHSFSRTLSCTLFLVAIFSLGFSLQGHALAETSDVESPAKIPAQDLVEKEALNAVAKECIENPAQAREILQRILDEKNPLSDSAVAEIIWTIFKEKKWTDELCEMAAQLLESRDVVAVMWADWALSIRTGWENSQEVPPWTYERESKPVWFAKWLAFPQERFHELDYWRVAASWEAHRTLGSLKASANKFLTRADGLYHEILANESASPEQKSRAQAARQNALEILAKIERSEDIFEARQLYVDFRTATREIILANPALDFDEILFTKRHSVHGLRNITGSQYPWSHKPGGDLCVKSGFSPSAPTRPLIQGRLEQGHVHGTDLHWDGERIVFGYAEQPTWPLPKPTHTNDAHWFFDLRSQTPSLNLYEIKIDGSGLRQITNHPYWGDFEPTYAPDGGIVFASDRSARSSECGNFGADHTVINLFRCDADGQNIRMLSDNKDIDRYPRTLANGLIGYTRWEYQERHFTEVHAFWTIRPDGTYAEAAYKQHFNTPWGLRDVRDIPNSNKYVAIATGHHTLAYGQIVIFDLLGGPNDSSRMYTLTPHLTTGEGPSVRRAAPQGGLVDNVGRYSGPFPLSETTFLASWSAILPAHNGKLGGDTQFALYIVDAYGNRELIHRDRVYSCDFGTPIRKRPAPYPVADGRMSTEKFPHPICYIEDVNKGLPAEEQGKVKYIRLMQRVGWPLDDQIGAMRWAPGNAWERIFGFWAWAPAREIGTVPVEDDGSAWFYVPANISIYFQALDENHLEIRRMRSHISLENGESRGCIGCHETRPQVVSPKPGSFAKAFRRAPSYPQEPAWGSENLIAYEPLIQPILDRHCVECHNAEKAEGNLVLSGERDEKTGMLRSYLSLFPKGKDSVALRPKRMKDETTGELRVEYPLVSLSDKHSGASITQTREFGSSQSRLIRILLDDDLHAKEVRSKMSNEDWIALVTWVDANAPYYDTFFNRRDPTQKGPVRNVRMEYPLSIHMRK
ncbi:MAG: hypothetical protein Q4D38_04930 [Planctomycetia bacterium]|nr:hypothetical protein [Planctomycetia bacterium]